MKCHRNGCNDEADIIVVESPDGVKFPLCLGCAIECMEGLVRPYRRLEYVTDDGKRFIVWLLVQCNGHNCEQATANMLMMVVDPDPYVESIVTV